METVVVGEDWSYVYVPRHSGHCWVLFLHIPKSSRMKKGLGNLRTPRKQKHENIIETLNGLDCVYTDKYKAEFVELVEKVSWCFGTIYRREV